MQLKREIKTPYHTRVRTAPPSALLLLQPTKKVDSRIFGDFSRREMESLDAWGLLVFEKGA